MTWWLTICEDGWGSMNEWKCSLMRHYILGGGQIGRKTWVHSYQIWSILEISMQRYFVSRWTSGMDIDLGLLKERWWLMIKISEVTKCRTKSESVLKWQWQSSKKYQCIYTKFKKKNSWRRLIKVVYRVMGEVKKIVMSHRPREQSF